MSFNVHGHYAVTVRRFSIQLGVWGVVSPQADPGQSPGAGAGGEAPGSSENLAFYSIEKEV